MTTALRVLALTMLLAVRARTLSNGVDDYYGWTGGERFTKLDRFLQDRMGVGGNKSEPAALQTTANRGLWSRTSTAASVAVPEDEDDGGEDDDENDDEEEEEPRKVLAREPVKLRHQNRWEEENTINDKNIQKHEPARTLSPLSDYKWKFLGSRKMVEETFRRTHVISSSQGDNENDEVKRHQSRISKETLCKVPRAKVIKVSDFYPSSNKMYMPSCTVLHVCADDTGCCNSPTLKCGPKSAQPIHLPFIVFTAPGLGERQSSEQKSLLFHNHTECQCQFKGDDMMPRDTEPPAVDLEIDTPMHRTGNSCKCPMEYTVRYLANGSCSCDCFDKQRECIRYKKGNIYFNHLDKYCINSGQCLLPMCEYGVYSHRTGRCPKKFEKLYSFKNKHYF